MTRKRPRLGRGAIEIGIADANEERLGLALEAVELAALAFARDRAARARRRGRDVEQEREIGLAVAVDPLLELADPRVAARRARLPDRRRWRR